MDQAIRNQLQRATQDARQLLEAEFAEQLEGTYDVLPDGMIHDEPGTHLNDRQCLTRQKLVDAIQHRIAGGKTSAEAVVDYTREAAFTFLNRFVALKMLEARGLVQQCISKGEQSSGFKEFTGLAPGLAELPDKGYHLYLECLFDELSIEIKILFDRHDVASLLWPRRQTLTDLLAILNQTDLDSVWDQDETIGWIYQYFNSSEERKKMREESAAPRNSHELAVRNQFFTPRYVVEFLTDNTLGRIWYEMRKGKTRLVDECRYLVRRPSEVFLDEGQEPPKDDSETDKDLSQEELLKKTVYVPHRPKKDPRDLKILDPACGSGHFLLYCFDLLLTIYEEAWHDEESPPAKDVPGPDGKSPAKALHEDYETIDALREAVPGLILRHNLHGIEIDPRCAQIAAFALWMQAQRAYSAFGAARNERQPIRKTNIAIAEPMPGEPELLKEFIGTLNPPLLGKLVEVAFENMKLAGEAGSLLKIDEEIRDSITEARKQWDKAPEQIQMNLFGSQPARQEKLDFSGITDDDFWQQAEERIYEALHRYVARMRNGHNFSRRLFAEDTERGFAFIDLCRKRYDLVLMNPPFGEAATAAKNYLGESFSTTKYDLFAMFVARWLNCLESIGYLGAITNKTGFFLQTFEKWRQLISTQGNTLSAAMDLGFGVLDSAMVETMAYTIKRSPPEVADKTVFIRLAKELNKQPRLEDTIAKLRSSGSPGVAWLKSTSEFDSIPHRPMCYWAGPEFVDLFRSGEPFAPHFGHIYQGIATGDNFRFLRTRWEVSSQILGNRDWVTYAKGGASTLWISDFPLIVLWPKNGSEIKANAQQCYGSASRTIKNEDVFFKPGLTYTQVTVKGFFARALPEGGVFDMKGPLVLVESGGLYQALGVFCSSPIRALAKLITDCRQWHPTNLMQLPYPKFGINAAKSLEDAVKRLVVIRQTPLRRDEISSLFCFPREGDGQVEDEVLVAEIVDSVVAKGFGSSVTDFRELDLLLQPSDTRVEDEDEDEAEDTLNPKATSVSYALGVTLGRWDIRFATGEKPAPELPDPFTPLPVCPPGQLQNEQGLPITREEVIRLNEEGRWTYPIEIPWDGILVDDPGHPLDIEARIRQVLQVIWKDRWEAIEREACEILGARTFRHYFRKPAGFFADHVKRYSKSRRKAPIYWQLAIPSGSYSVWLYYHRFTPDTFYKVLNDYVKPKLDHEQRKLDRLRVEAGPEPTRSQRGEIDQQETFVTELKTFAEEIERIAPLWNPDLNDGVIINFAPLWRLVPQHKAWQKECKEVWGKLVKGDYDWAHLAMHLWPERVVPKCRTDASLAIAHGLEEVFWEQNEKGKWVIKDAPDEGWESTINKLVAERTSPAVKAAMDSLLNAPAPGNGKRTLKTGKRRKKSR